MTNPTPTPHQEKLLEYFQYCKESGKLVKIKKTSNKDRLFVPIIYKNADGYIYFKFEGKSYLAHRIIWKMVLGEEAPHPLDHKNTIKDDNSWNNLRPATRQFNGLNTNLQKNNTSGIKGVNWSKKRKKWQAKIKINYTTINLGYFDDIQDAACARKEAGIKYGLEFSREGSECQQS